MPAMILRMLRDAVLACVSGATLIHSAAADTVVPKPQKTLLIAHTDALAPVAKAWAGYRVSHSGGSWDVVIHPVDSTQQPDAIRIELQQIIRDVWKRSGSPPIDTFAVLLLGDTDTAKHSGIPSWYFPQHDSVMRSGDGRNDQFASDQPYQLMDDADDVPDIMLGRIPARTVDDALAALEKIIRYETPPTLEELLTGQRARITYTAGEGHFGPMDGVLEELFKMMVDRMVPDAFDMHMIYAKSSSIYCPPPSRLTETVLDQLHSGSLLFNYIGHGFETGFDSLRWNMKRYPILNVHDLEMRTQDMIAPASEAEGDVRERRQQNQMPIAFLSCCSTGCFDLADGSRSMAEELFFNTNGGAVAVISGSRITHPYANTVMQMNITKSLLVDRTPLIGLLDLHADRAMLNRTALDRQLDSIAAPIARTGRWETSLRDLRSMHVKLYNLIGDPAMRLALPSSRIANLKFENGVLTGEVPHMKTGRVTVEICTARTSMTQSDKVHFPVGDNDPDLEAKAAHNFALVNERVLKRMESEVAEGQFSLALPEAMPVNAAMIRVIAVGLDDAENAIDSVGAIRLRQIQPSEVTP